MLQLFCVLAVRVFDITLIIEDIMSLGVNISILSQNCGLYISYTCYSPFVGLSVRIFDITSIKEYIIRLDVMMVTFDIVTALFAAVLLDV